MKNDRPIRILQVVSHRLRGGVETWFMHVLRHIDRRRFQMDFLVPPSDPCDYDDEIEELGSRTIRCPRPRHPIRYARHFRRSLREHGPYDVVHSHLHHFNGFVLWLAAKAGVQARIAHSHFDMREVYAKASLVRRAYLRLMQRWIDRYATDRLAVSRQAGLSLYDGEGRPSWQVLPLGLDFEPFRQCVDRTAVRAELGIPAGACVIGHVGRFEEQKNHRFLLEIMAEAARRDPNVYLLLIGDGSLRTEVEREAVRRSLRDRVVFAGVRPDVPRLMRGAMDTFVFPSNYEGLGLVAVEAQAAGLPCFLADIVPMEADLVPALVRRFPRTDPSAWVEAILQAIKNPRAVDGNEALAIVQDSPLNIHNAVKALERVYEGAIASRIERSEVTTAPAMDAEVLPRMLLVGGNHHER